MSAAGRDEPDRGANMLPRFNPFIAPVTPACRWDSGPVGDFDLFCPLYRAIALQTPVASKAVSINANVTRDRL